MNDTARYARIETEFGRLLVAYQPGDGRITASMLDGDEGAFLRGLIEASGEPPGLDLLAPPQLAANVSQAIEATVDPGCVDLASLSRFQRRVLEATAAIPRGEVRTYGEIALAIGSPGAARAVGTALAKNPLPVVIPCHRVVRANGDLGNYNGPGGPGSKERLLRLEGAI
jgi:methylated-DNA-[protein]-cysteine S-methyltransferase